MKYIKDLNREPISIDELQRLLLGEDIPIEIAKELAIIILKQRFIVDQINPHPFSANPLNSEFLHLCHSIYDLHGDRLIPYRCSCYLIL